VFLTPETGVLAADLSRKLIFELSTIDTETSLDVGNQVRQKHPSASFYDAPVSGGDIGADAATLTIMVGCAEKDPNWPKIEAILSTMGRDIIACGGPSHGLTAKICNNYCSSIITIATSDTFNMAIRAGMDPRLLQRIFKTSSCANNNCQVMNPVPGLSPKAPPSHGYKGGFKVQYMVKDVGLALQMAKLNGVTLAMGNMSMGVYSGAAKDPRCKDLDSKVVYRYLGGLEDWAEHFE
jgi:3-hydroxyisobutyrate dehydrogenase